MQGTPNWDIQYLENSDNMSAEAASAAQASSVEDALDLLGARNALNSYDWADAAARTAQTGMEEGDRGYQRDVNRYYYYTGSAWSPEPSRILPSSVTNGSLSGNGIITSTAQTLVRVRDAFPTDFRTFRIVFDCTMSAAVGLLLRFAVGATDASTAYDYQRTSAVSTTLATVQDLNQGSGSVSPIGLAARHVGEIIVMDVNTTSQTIYDGSSVVTANPMTTSAGKAWVGGQHRTATAYDSFSLFGSSGNVTVNRLTVEGVN